VLKADLLVLTMLVVMRRRRQWQQKKASDIVGLSVKVMEDGRDMLFSV
jgi:hypothetical protein